MPKDIDQRDFSFIRDFDKSGAEEKSSKKLPDNHTIKINHVNKFFGGAQQVQSVYASDVSPGGSGEDTPKIVRDKKLPDYKVIAQALRHLERTCPALGFRRSDKPEFVPDPFVKKTSAGTRIVNFLQHHRGIPVFQMERSVEIDRGGKIKSVAGTSTSLRLDLEIMPRVTLEDAAMAAAQYVASPSERIDRYTQEPVPDTVIDLKDYRPRVLARIPLISQPAVLDKGPFGDVIPAHLIFFYQGRETRLGWHMIISTEGFRDQYTVIVEADSKTKDFSRPEVLYGQRALSSMAAATGRVWAHNPKINLDRQPVNFPRPLADYPFDPLPVVPQGFPFHWVKDGTEATQGNNTIAVFDETNTPFKGLRGADDVVVFDADEEKGNDQKVLNAFYFCNFMHDFYFMLGFDEELNFQEVNFTGVGTGNDPINVIVTNNRIDDLARFSFAVDGKAIIELGTVSLTDNRLHTALDSDVVFHEFTHGVTRRVVGRSLDRATALQAIISGALGEGWSDYFALTIQNYNLEPERTTILEYTTTDGRGLRSHPFDDDYPQNAGVPDNDLGGVYGRIGLPPYTNPHAIGEIWCAALMKMNRDLGKAFNDKKRGYRLGWQIVFDALKKDLSNPAFIDARDNIVTSLDDLRDIGSLTLEVYQKARRAIWGAFAHFGIGFNAERSQLNSLLTVGDKTLPPDL